MAARPAASSGCRAVRLWTTTATSSSCLAGTGVRACHCPALQRMQTASTCNSTLARCEISASYKSDTAIRTFCRTHCLYTACSWRLVEAAQGIQNALPKDTSVLGGLNEATYLAQQAKAHNFNVMRLFGIADVNYNEGMPLQPSPGQHSRLCTAPAIHRVYHHQGIALP